MADKEYIERGALLKTPPFTKYGGYPSEYVEGYLDCAEEARKAVNDAPAADVISRGVFEQVKWERDMAMQQLEEHGIPFGGTADNVVAVVRCKNCKYTEMIVDIIGNPQLYCRHHRYYPNVDFDDFCSWGKRKEQT